MTSVGAPGSGSRRVLLNALYRGVGEAGSKVAALALQIAIARLLGDEGFGVFVYAVSFVGLVTVLGDFGQDVILAREVARDRERLDQLYGPTIGLRVSLSLPALGIGIVVGRALGLTVETCAVIALIGAAYIVDYVTKTSFAVFQAYERLGYISLVLVIQRWTTAIVGGVLLLAGVGIVTVAAVYLAGSIVALLLTNAMLFRRVVRPRFSLRSRGLSALFLVALPVGLAGVFYTLLFRVDALILGAYESTAVVGQYGAATRLLEGTLFLSWGIAAALLPVFSRSGEKTDPTLALVYEKGLKLVASVALPVALIGGLLAEPIVEVLYGSQFEPAVSALRLIAATIFLYGLNIVSSYVLVARGKTKRLAFAYAVGLGLNVGLNVVLIPAFSLDGSAAATTLTEIAMTFSVVAMARHGAGAGVSLVRALAGPLVAGLLAGSAVLLLAGDPALGLVLGLTTYAGALAAVERLLFPDDFGLVLRAIRARGLPASISRPG